MGDPLFIMFGFVLLGIWIVMFALPIIRRPPPGCIPKVCPSCKVENFSEADKCKDCGKPLP